MPVWVYSFLTPNSRVDIVFRSLKNTSFICFREKNKVVPCWGGNIGTPLKHRNFLLKKQHDYFHQEGEKSRWLFEQKFAFLDYWETVEFIRESHPKLHVACILLELIADKAPEEVGRIVARAVGLDPHIISTLNVPLTTPDSINIAVTFRRGARLFGNVGRNWVLVER